MTIAIYGSRSHECDPLKLKALLEHLAAAGAEIVMHEKLYQYLVHLFPSSLGCVRRVVSDNNFSAQIALSLGGDGTFLRTAAWVGDKQLPVLGVNTGHLGYLTGVSLDDLLCGDPASLKGLEDFEIETRSLLEVTDPSLAAPYAVNEVALFKSDNASMIVAECSLNGNFLADYRADGLIVATPTGSTAYNLSAGGPIVAPRTPALVISPVDAHTLTMRPLVIPDDGTLGFKVSSRSDRFRLSLDGRNISLGCEKRVEIRKAPFPLKVLVRKNRFFADTLRTKLGWGNDSRNY